MRGQQMQVWKLLGFGTSSSDWAERFLTTILSGGILTEVKAVHRIVDRVKG